MVNTNTMLGILLSLKDEASQGIDKAGFSLKGLASTATEAGAQFLVIKESITQAATMVNDFTGRAFSFDQAMTRSAIAMGLTNTEAEGLKNEIKNLADETLNGIYTSQQAADAFKAIADEGRGLEGTLTIVKDAMNLAAATGDDLAMTTSNVEDIMSAWNLTTEESGRVVDVLMNTFRETGAPAAEVSGQLVQMGQIMDQLGISLEEGSALIGTFKDVGVGGVTGLLSAFTQLTNSETKASKSLAAMGVSALDASGKLKTPTVLFGELKKAGMSATEALELFGIRGSGAMVAAVENIETVGRVAESNLNATGTAADAAGQYAESSAAKQEKFNAALEDMQLQLAEGVIPALTGFFGIIQPVLDTLTQYPEIIYAIVGGLIAYKIATVAQTIATAGGTAALWANTMAMLANPVTLIAVAVALLILGLIMLYKNWDQVTASVENFTNGAGGAVLGFFRNLVDVIVSLATAWVESGTGMVTALEDAFAWLDNFFGDLWNDFLEWGKDMMEAFRKGIENAGDGVKDAVGDVAHNIQKTIGFSLPEEGPLRETPLWGKHFVQELSGGMLDEIPLLERRIGMIAAAAVITLPAPGGGSPTYMDNRSRNNEIHMHVTNVDEDAIVERLYQKMNEGYYR